jgi:hypothetical protein
MIMATKQPLAASITTALKQALGHTKPQCQCAFVLDTVAIVHAGCGFVSHTYILLHVKLAAFPCCFSRHKHTYSA